MRTRTIIAALAMLMTVGAAMAQEAGERQRRQREGEGRGPAATGEARPEGRQRPEAAGEGMRRGGDATMPTRPAMEGRGADEIGRALRGMELTEEQREQVQKILEEHRKAMAEFQEQHGEELQKLNAEMREARQSGDREAAQAAMAKMQGLNQQRMALAEKLRVDLAGVLSEEQMAQLNMVAPAGRFRQTMAAVRQLDLTAEQKSQIEQIVREARPGDDGAEPNFAEATRKVMEVLTDEQRAELRRQVGPAGGPRAVPGRGEGVPRGEGMQRGEGAPRGERPRGEGAPGAGERPRRGAPRE